MILHANQLQPNQKINVHRGRKQRRRYILRKRSQLRRSEIKNGPLNSNLSATVVMAELQALLEEEVVDVVDCIHQFMVTTMRQNHTTTIFLMSYFPVYLGRKVVGDGSWGYRCATHVVKGDNEKWMEVVKNWSLSCREIKSYTCACIKNKRIGHHAIGIVI